MRKHIIKKLSAAFVFAAVSAFFVAPADVRAQPAPYPHKVVTLVTHSSPGGGSDVFLRERTVQRIRWLALRCLRSAARPLTPTP